jgi:hypothetical protein
MRIRALSVFEGIVYHCWSVDRTNPCRPTLEVDAVLREGDADERAGPLLVAVPDYLAMVGDPQIARACLDELAQKGRIVQHLGVAHIAFPIWTRVDETGDDVGPVGGFGGGDRDGPGGEPG